MNLKDAIIDNKLHILVKPNSKNNEILDYNSEKKAIRITIAAPADKDKANKELLRFVSKQLGKRVVFVSGLRSREKVLKRILKKSLSEFSTCDFFKIPEKSM